MHHAATIARCAKANMFIYGPPGGAKSALVKWMFAGEDEPAFQMQLHQMMTDQAFIGGQYFEKAKLGEFEVNTKGSLADFKVALIDEAEKGNPAALSALLSLLNEREILAGNQVIKARTETVFATSNANLPEIFQHFVSNGQGSTAAAFLNRFQIKGMVYNWLSAEDQVVLDKRRQRSRYLSAVSKFSPNAKKDEVFVAAEKIDWDSLRLFADILISPSQLFMVSFREFMTEMRTETNRAVRESEEKHRNNRNAEPFIYFPSFPLIKLNVS
jgi:MoxR-like ATPase